MGKVIQFPVRESNGYSNLSRLFSVANSVESVNFYLETLEQLKKDGYLLPGEYEKLKDRGRSKRLELAKPEPVAAKHPEKPGTYLYTSEMGQEKPVCQMEASRGYYGGHMYIDTPLEIKGRGIAFVKRYSEKDFVNPNNHKVGWNHYRVTNRAFEKLKQQYTISMECLLD